MGLSIPTQEPPCFYGRYSFVFHGISPTIWFVSGSGQIDRPVPTPGRPIGRHSQRFLPIAERLFAILLPNFWYISFPSVVEFVFSLRRCHSVRKHISQLHEFPIKQFHHFPLVTRTKKLHPTQLFGPTINPIASRVCQCMTKWCISDPSQRQP